MPGVLLSIHIAETAEAPMRSIESVRAITGSGLSGDRYSRAEGTYSTPRKPDQEVTLIELESLDAFTRESGVALAPGDARRNLVTRGVRLNDLVGREFTIGEVRLGGLRLCEPCAHLAKLTHPEVLPGLVHRGGLRARILTDGLLRVGDVIHD